jgi:hypothetical protein
MKTPLTQLHEYIRENKNVSREGILNKIAELFPEERFQILRAYMGFFNITMSDDELKDLKNEAENYFNWQYLRDENPKK